VVLWWLGAVPVVWCGFGVAMVSFGGVVVVAGGSFVGFGGLLMWWWRIY
jgi:hypothetical protein